MLAPICLFTYNRPIHTRQTIEALQRNKLAKDSVLYIYSDASKTLEGVIDVNKVREYIKTIDGFKEIHIIEQVTNQGLGKSIISGVTKVIQEYGKIIVLEDDLITSPFFLKYMNDALELYKNRDEVWHISAYTFPIEIDNNIETFFLNYTSSTGWGTWLDKWAYFERAPQKLLDDGNRKYIKRFNVDGAENVWKQVKRNNNGEIYTWAVFWYATVFNNNGFCLYPSESLIKNIGYDGSGDNCGESNSYDKEVAVNEITKFEERISVDKKIHAAYKEFKNKIKHQYYKRIKNRIIRIIN
jgi:hypothetical protein